VSASRASNIWIPLSDGCRLSARLWLPDDGRPAPAVLEYIPYPKDHFTAAQDESRMAWFAGHGYAGLRVDLRGSGDSDGVLLDEYLPQEQDDAVEAIAWIAAQPWCDGAVGMMGYSWGGFNGLQVAARRPPALKAVISGMSSDDRYSDDVHYIGGSILADTQHSWATSMLAYATLPPDPAVVGDRWREMWQERLEGVRPMIEPWLAHQRRDAYWQHGSVCEEPDEIECPVMLVGGWSDGYRDAVLRMLETLPVPRRGLIGPWSHNYPQEQAAPGPTIGFLQECLRWWDEWLKGIPGGVRDEPMLMAWMQEPAPPLPFYETRPGRWVSETRWPPERPLRPLSLALGSDGVLGGDLSEQALGIQSPEITGFEGGFWCPFGNPGDWAPDQRGEEGRSLCFTSPPIEQRLELLGRPLVHLRISCDRPLAQIAVRLNAVSADGSSTVLTRGFLNLTHRASHADPEPLVPGRIEDVSVELQSLGQAVEAGQRLRLALSTSYWPWLWPSPEHAMVTVHAGAGSRLELPVREPLPDEGAGPSPVPESAPPLPHRVTRSHTGERELVLDPAERSWQLTHTPKDFDLEIEGGLRVDWSGPDVYRIVEREPLSAGIDSERTVSISRESWQARVHVTSVMRSDADSFLVDVGLTASSLGEDVFAREWQFRIRRDLV
jgi:putative CocE/NonD family hydrolase